MGMHTCHREAAPHVYGRCKLSPVHPPSCVTASLCAVLHAAISTGDWCGGEIRSEHPLLSQTLSSSAGTLPLHQLLSCFESLPQLALYAMCVASETTNFTATIHACRNGISSGRNEIQEEMRYRKKVSGRNVQNVSPVQVL